jgi:predicted TIM-barrel fold metal-dependent hydrolase
LENTPDIPGPIADTRRPATRFPAGACDCHAHIFGPGTKLLPNTHFVPPDCPLSDYLRMLRTIGCERAVLVQPSVYGTDNSMIVQALKLGNSASAAFPMRAVAVVSESVTDKELEDLHAAGFRGIRINTASATPGLKLEHAPRLAERIKPMGWHLQFYSNFSPELGEQLQKLPVSVVIDHFGRIPASGGLDSPAFRAFLEFLRRENSWTKLMGPYFVSDAFPRYPDLVPFAQAIVKAAPERVLWGTDWPHPSARAKMPNDGDLADLLAEWAPDEAQRKRILADNPKRLYGFK